MRKHQALNVHRIKNKKTIIIMMKVNILICLILDSISGLQIYGRRLSKSSVCFLFPAIGPKRGQPSTSGYSHKHIKGRSAEGGGGWWGWDSKGTVKGGGKGGPE